MTALANTSPTEVPPRVLGALTHLASNGGAVNQTVREIDISKPTLIKYRRQFPELYSTLTAKLQGEAEQRLTDKYLTIASEAADGAHEAAKQTLEMLEAKQVEKPWTTLLPLTTAAAISTDKRQILLERPTSINVNVDPSEIVESLRRKANSVEGTASEIPHSTAKDPMKDHKAPLIQSP